MEEAVRVRVVRRDADVVVTDRLDHLAERLLVGVGRDEALPEEYWLGSWEICTSEPGPNFSHASSSRHRYQGSQPHVPSRKAQRRRGWRSSPPPAAMLPNAIISSTGFRPATPITRPFGVSR